MQMMPEGRDLNGTVIKYEHVANMTAALVHGAITGVETLHATQEWRAPLCAAHSMFSQTQHDCTPRKKRRAKAMRARFHPPAAAAPLDIIMVENFVREYFEVVHACHLAVSQAKHPQMP